MVDGYIFLEFVFILIMILFIIIIKIIHKKSIINNEKKVFSTKLRGFISNTNKPLKNINYNLMNTDTNFINIYNEITSKYKIKYVNVKMPIIRIIIIHIIIFIILYLWLKKLNFAFYSTLFILIISLFINLIIKANKEIKLNSDNGNICEEHLIEKLGKTIYPSFKEDNIELLFDEIKSDYNNSNLCNLTYSEIYVKECYSFLLNNNPNSKVNFYNIESVYNPRYCTNSNIKDNIVFSGILCKVNLDFYIDGFIKISPDDIIDTDKNRIELDSNYFENNFDTLTNNKILTMTLLTSDFMNELNDLKNKYDIDFEIYVNNNIMYISFNDYILNNINVLQKPDLKETYISYCKVKHLIDIINLFYNKLKEIN